MAPSWRLLLVCLVSMMLLAAITTGWTTPAASQAWEQYLQGYHGPYRGQVIDAETKRPLAGAVVLAEWDRVKVELFHSATVFHDALEVLTDANGAFVIHAGAIERNAPAKTLRPIFLIYYPGYGFFPRYQVAPAGFIGGIFEGAGTTVELPRRKTHEERLDVIRGLPPGGVPDEKMPNLLQLMNEERIGLGLQPAHLRGRK